MKTYPFSALLARMKYITRWGADAQLPAAESLSEHTADTALLAPRALPDWPGTARAPAPISCGPRR